MWFPALGSHCRLLHFVNAVVLSVVYLYLVLQCARAWLRLFLDGTR